MRKKKKMKMSDDTKTLNDKRNWKKMEDSLVNIFIELN